MSTCDSSRPSSASASPAMPDQRGYFGDFGGAFIPETLRCAVEELATAYASALADPEFDREYQRLLRDFVGRETPLLHADRLSDFLGGAQIYLKREDLCHTGAHKINNALGQALLTKRMGKKRVIAETGAGQHGVATATACARLGLECVVYMGTEDMRRQRPNVLRMQLLGATVVGVDDGNKTLSDALNAALRDWMGSSATTHYIIGTVAGPHPFPMIVRNFQSVIGTEARAQILEKTGRLPDHLVACVGGGSNAGGLFYPFINDSAVKIHGVEAGGRGTKLGDHAARFCFGGKPGVLHGMKSYVLQTDDGQTAPVHSISAGLDYPSVGPEHAYWHDSGRVRYTSASDSEALEAFQLLARHEGILPAIESSHALAETVKLARSLPKDQVIIMNLSGRGDKDLDEVVRLLGM